MLLVSTFELLFERNVPIAVSTAVGTTVGGRVYEGYFLTVTNLDTVDRRYSLELVITPPANPTDPVQRFNRTLDQCYFVVELNSAAAPLPPTPLTKLNDTTYSFTFSIPAQQTALVSVFPPFLPMGATDPSTAFSDVNPVVEVRGFARLYAIPRTFIERIAGFTTPVLLSPELRGTFLPENFPPAHGTTPPEPPEFEEIIRGVPLAGGSARETIVSPPLIIRPILDEPLVEP